MTAQILDFEEQLALRLPPLRLGELHRVGSRIRLHADCVLTPSAAELLAKNLIELARQAREASR